jgi:predicted N-acetyltransferase YhbS
MGRIKNNNKGLSLVFIDREETEGTMMLYIRNEKETDYKLVEDITRKAFYNMYIPGCIEHYLVHIMRGHEDFIPELDFVLELDGKVIGNIMYTKAELTDEEGSKKEIVTFGPVSVLPEYQRNGYGKMLIEHSLNRAAELGYEAVVIFGSPSNYVSSGFKCCKKYNVCVEKGKYPAAMLVKELKPGVLDGRIWFYSDSPVMSIDEGKAREFDDSLEKMEKRWMPSQEEFYIMSQSFVE